MLLGTQLHSRMFEEPLKVSPKNDHRIFVSNLSRTSNHSTLRNCDICEHLILHDCWKSIYWKFQPEMWRGICESLFSCTPPRPFTFDFWWWSSTWLLWQWKFKIIFMRSLYFILLVAPKIHLDILNEFYVAWIVYTEDWRKLIDILLRDWWVLILRVRHHPPNQRSNSV